MKNLEPIGNHLKGIARYFQILLDFHRGCQRFPESLKDPQGKDCAFLRGTESPSQKQKNLDIPSPSHPMYSPSLTAGKMKERTTEYKKGVRKEETDSERKE